MYKRSIEDSRIWTLGAENPSVAFPLVGAERRTDIPISVLGFITPRAAQDPVAVLLQGAGRAVGIDTGRIMIQPGCHISLGFVFSGLDLTRRDIITFI